ncbi:MAG: LCP family protein, partial [Clostridiales bacterium]|nr:LCP family protein [Clostridiales bacterium]
MRQPKKRRRFGCFGCLFRLALLIALTWTLATLAVSYLPFFRIGGRDANLAANADLPGDRLNVLLLGVDASDPNDPGRTDTIMIASVPQDGGAIELISVMRDTIVDIPGHGSGKINAAYRYGGAELTVRTINENFGLNIECYASVDFASFPYLIDAMGGVRMTVTGEELPLLNRLVLSMKHLFQRTNVDVSQLAAAGERVRLTGLQALAYSRIRQLDSDYGRASRQRQLLNALLAKARTLRNPATLANLAATGVRHLDTNMSKVKLAALGGKVLLSGA